MKLFSGNGDARCFAMLRSLAKMKTSPASCMVFKVLLDFY